MSWSAREGAGNWKKQQLHKWQSKPTTKKAIKAAAQVPKMMNFACISWINDKCALGKNTLHS